MEDTGGNISHPIGQISYWKVILSATRVEEYGERCIMSMERPRRDMTIVAFSLFVLLGSEKMYSEVVPRGCDI